MTYTDSHYIAVHTEDRSDDRAQVGTWNCFASEKRAQEFAELMARDGVTIAIEACDGECYGHDDGARSECPHAIAEPCAYCGSTPEYADRALVPDEGDDAEWTRLAEQHDVDCEWIATRAHRR
ncbi:MAG: hypothetical protein NUW01_03725 [Gemmatimonadaceae bacterium]|nr:hypothetical protein [Gemmatimonadaceae bacterium]